MSGEEIQYFAARNSKDEITHLVRTIRTETELRAQFFRDGGWRDDAAALSIADDGAFSRPIDAAEASQIVIRNGFDAYFPAGGPALPLPIPARGEIEGRTWRARFVFRDEGGEGSMLELFAEKPLTQPLRARIHGDGTAETLETFLDNFYVNPSLGETEEDGRRRMHEHNERIRAELRAAGLLPDGG